jgi:hypothetical protein
MDFAGGTYRASSSLVPYAYLTNSTIVSDSTSAADMADGGGIYHSNTTPIFIKNCPVALNTAGSAPDVFGHFASSASLASEGFNLISKTNDSNSCALRENLDTARKRVPPEKTCFRRVQFARR